MRNKEDATRDYINMIKQSWTYDRMTETERAALVEAVKFAKVAGAYETRWSILQSVNYAFLLALGYKGGDWRRKADEPLF